MSMRLFLPLLCFVGGLGCSYVEIPFDDGSDTNYLTARSMELGNIDNACTYKIAVVPRRGSVAQHDHNIQGQYGYLGVNNIFLGLISYPFEGMNEKGLTVSALEFRQAVYEAPQTGKADVDMFQVLQQLLANCDTVNSSLAYLATVRVTDSILPSHHKHAGPFGLGLHWAITDTSGRSVAVEYLQGQRVVYENTPRVMTNDPDMHWHWRNLNTYASLSPNFPHQNDVLKVDTEVGAIPRAVGHGWNLFGLPGDSSPPSRFVNLFYLREYAVHVQSMLRKKTLLRKSQAKAALSNVDAAIVLGTDILDRVVIPLGTVAENKKELFIDSYDLTDYAILKVPTRRQFIIRAHKNSQWRQINLTKIDFSSARSWPLEDGTYGIKDITSEGVEASKSVQV